MSEELYSTPETTAQRVSRVIAYNTERTTDANFSPDARLEADLGADSLSRVEIALELEDELEIELPDDDIESLVTVQDVFDLVDRALARKAEEAGEESGQEI